jgi:holo-[acyl-carrier protein] synthase|tara:strand:+ start:1201 stop:1587 length:387 start_codon:yes stop_codon:yes gene_type:complete
MSDIFGIGTDIVDISRIKKLFHKNKKLKKRLFSKEEIKNCESLTNKIACYSKRFAAKEAFVKALGTGISKGISFNEISINNNKKGAPFIKLIGKTKKIVKNLIKKNNKIYLSLSDEKKYALAMVVISH